MKKILDLISEEVVKAFEEAGYSADFAKVTLSNRPDLCEYQCNGALAAAKTYKKAPIMIANDVEGKRYFPGSTGSQSGLYQPEAFRRLSGRVFKTDAGR